MRFSRNATPDYLQYRPIRYVRNGSMRPTPSPIEIHVKRGLFAGKFPTEARRRSIPLHGCGYTRNLTEISGKLCYNRYMCEKAYGILDNPCFQSHT